VIELELLNAADRRLKTERAEGLIGNADAVDEKSGGFLTIARGIDGNGANPPQGRRGEAGLRRRDRAGSQQSEIGEVASVEWNFLHRLRRHHVADAGRHPIDERGARLDHDRFGGVAQFELEVADERAAAVETQRGDGQGLEAGRARSHIVRLGRDVVDAVTTLTVRHDRTVDARRVVPYTNRGPAKHRSGSIEHSPLQRRRRLGAKRSGGQRAEDERQRDRSHANFRGWLEAHVLRLCEVRTQSYIGDCRTTFAGFEHVL